MSNIIQTFPKGSGGGHVVLDTNGTAVDQEKKLQFTGLDVSDDSTNEKTEVKAVGLNADSLNDIIQSASVQGNAVAGNGLVYSTTEQVVGKWIDGKPIYQKTIFFNPVMYVSSTAWSATNEDVSNIENIISGEGYSVDGSRQSRPMCLFLDGVLKIMSGRDNVGSDSISGVTYRYTKTTDT